ncbi:very short patch repair endonuclease [Pseudomonas nitroreducens]|uniref:very short patch repair endonuclease n=1 Tax=Pseudomonas nitroreducens TaxID=46680 RepID=UPI0024484116|nr:very short patch repair endonuclease [Pseudomonas nitroreducens]MDH1077109.1 very short patch repair endonuclease [Pseudomonas nitroreducens]
MDIVDPARRSRMMSGIRGKDTKPEMLVRRFLHAHGYRYRLHRKDLPGKPDIVIPRLKACIFVHGCFWHHHEGCSFAVLPKSRPDFWKAKLLANSSRDKQVIESLNDAGWTTIVIWECELRRPDASLQALLGRLRELEEQT